MELYKRRNHGPGSSWSRNKPRGCGRSSDGQPRKSRQRAIEFVIGDGIGVVSDEPLARSTIRSSGCSTNYSKKRQDGRDRDIGD